MIKLREQSLTLRAITRYIWMVGTPLNNEEGEKDKTQKYYS